MFSVYFLVGILTADPDNGQFEFHMWGFNILYFVATLITVLIDVFVRFNMPEKYCTPSFQDPNSCQATWDQLCWFWTVYAVFAIVWFFAIRKMSVHVFKKMGGNFL